MKKILGLDLGSTSIGWAFIEEDDKASVIKRLGVRIIPYTGDEKDEFTKGQTISVNKGRTQKRTARKTNHRYKLRKKALTDMLTRHGMMPEEALLKRIDPVLLYGIRARAATDKITLPELGRVLYLLNQKRGYKSSRSSAAEEEGGKKMSDYLSELKERKELIERADLTIGQYFFREYEQDRWFRTRKKVFPRECYIAEFDRIWRTQQSFYPEVLTHELGNSLKQEIIYFQRRLKSQKHLVSECRFEKHHKVAPKSSPLFQLDKIWESVNAISFTNKANESLAISFEQKRTIFLHLEQNAKLSSTDLLKILGLKRIEGWRPNELIRKSGIPGNLTREKLKKAFKSAGLEDRADLLQFDVTITEEHTDMETGEITEKISIRKDFEKQPMYELWHLLYSVDDPNLLIPALMKRYGISQSQATTLSNIDFKKDGFGNKSARAIRKILPGLMKGMVYSDAATHVGYEHSDSLTREANEARELNDKLPLYSRNTLRQPVVEKILNQLVNLVNQILEDPALGRPDEIRVELARELRQSREERSDAYDRILKTDREHKDIVVRLSTEFPGLAVTRKVIEKYKLFVQQDGFCFYSGLPMTLSQVLRGEGVDVDHIIPQSKIFDDSFQNKVLALRTENAIKDKATAMDYMGSRSKDVLDGYLERVDRLFEDRKITRSKRDKLLMKEKDIPDDFINRQLNETRYVSRESMRLLKGICRDVFATSGRVTDFLRNQWGYNQVLKQLNWSSYEAAGKVSDGKIEGWSKRDDHRHHAIDALVVACTKQSFIQKLNRLNSTLTRQDFMEHVNEKSEKGWQARRSLLEQYVQTTRPFDTAQVKNAVSMVLISFKSGKKVATWSRNRVNGHVQKTLTPRGQLHMEQVYGKIRRYAAAKTALNGKFDKVDLIASPVERDLVRQRLESFGNKPKEAFKDLDKNPIWLDAAMTRALTEVTLWEEKFVYKYTLDQNFKESKIEAIIDVAVREKVRQRFMDRATQKDHPLKNLEQDPIWLNEEKRIPITRVRCFTTLKNVVPLHRSADGITTSQKCQAAKSKPTDYITTRNNHHIAIYEAPDGKLHETAVTLWEAVERKKNGIPVIAADPGQIWDLVLLKGIDDQKLLQNLPDVSWRMITSMQQYEMFVFRMTRDELDAAIRGDRFDLISPNLYRVQKISEGDYFFRHHLETKLEKDNAEAKEFLAIGKMIRISSLAAFKAQHPIKVHLDALGRLKNI
jgi:CRISPR-associated endonuclease Csn1